MSIIEAAIARHTAAEIAHRRAAVVARAVGRDPTSEEEERDRHHKAVVALTREIAPFSVRKVEQADHENREGQWP